MRTDVILLPPFIALSLLCLAWAIPRHENPMAAPEQDQVQKLKGTWGGDHISLEIGDSGAALEYDCAHGVITEQIAPDKNGCFSAKGTHTKESHGPVRAGAEPRDQAATYDGSVTGDRMELTVKIDETGESVGTFTLTRDQAGIIRKCR
jgi:hypothetical protein